MLDDGGGLVYTNTKKAKQRQIGDAVHKASQTLRKAADSNRVKAGSLERDIPTSSGKSNENNTSNGIFDYSSSNLGTFLKSAIKRPGKLKHELSQRLISQFPAISDTLEFFTGHDPRNIMKIDTSKMTNVIGREQLLQIVGLPPISDNVVDPPPVWDESEINGGQETWGSGNLVGQEYVERVLMRGQFLVLVPLEFKPKFARSLLNAAHIGTNERSSGFASVFEGFATRFETFLDRIDTRLNVAAYGYDSKINHYRYWIAVGAHMKVVLHTLGIDPLDTTVTASRYGSKYHQFLKERLPDFMVDRVFSHGNWKGINGLLGAGGNDGEILNELETNLEDKKSDFIQEVNKNVANRSGSDQTFGLNGGTATIPKPDKDKLINEFAGKGSKLFGLSDYGGGSGSAGENDDSHNQSLQDVPITLYNTSYANILNAVTNIDIRNSNLMNLPFITFYCNGNIDRNLQFSLDADKSVIAEQTTDVFARNAANLVRGGATALGELINKKAPGAGDAIKAVGDTAANGIDSAQEIFREIVYHGDSDLASSFVTNTYIPKIMKGGSTNVSYNVPLRFVAAGSDKYSIAQMFWGLCLLLPFVIQTTKPRMPLIIPQSAMYCAAFSKGVMNVPRGYISSMSISTDPAFQTTNGIPLELNINLTIESLYTVTTMPDFTETWGGSSDINLLTAMWHPMSSFNVVATLTGTNTVLNHTPSNIFKYFIEAPVSNAFVSFKTVFQSSGGYFGTQFKQWRLQLDASDNFQYV